MKANSVRALLWQHVKKEGSQRALAKKIGCSPTFLNDILLEHREPAGVVLAYLGLQRVSTYVPVSAAPADRSSASVAREEKP